MAIYEYYCAKCGQVFPLQRPMSESDMSASCPTCGTLSQRVLSSFASKIGYNLQIPTKEPLRKLDQG